jgi:hypothetical protein
MAIIPSSKYSGQIDTSDPTGYPQGEAKNVTVAGDGTGTPLEKAWVNDLWGFLQSLLDVASITPSGNPDKVGTSDYHDALDALFAGFNDTRIPTQNENNALVGTGTPSGSNVYVTEDTFDEDVLKPKAWGIIQTGPSISVVYGQNVTSVSTPASTYCRVVIPSGLLNSAATSMVMCSDQNGSAVVGGNVNSTTTLDFTLRNATDGATINHDTTVRTFQFLVYGVAP